MHIAIYVCAIVLALFCIVLFFVLREKKQKERLRDFEKKLNAKDKKNDEKITNQIVAEKQKTQPELVETKEVPAEKNIVQLEDFDLTDEESSLPGSAKVNSDKKTKDGENVFYDELNNEYYDKKFSEYEQFLKDNLDDDSVDVGDLDDDEVLDTVNSMFDESLEEKNDDVSSNKLSEKDKKILQDEILDKPKFEDEED